MTFFDIPLFNIMLKMSQFTNSAGGTGRQAAPPAVGDKVVVITTQGQATPSGLLPSVKQFTVVHGMRHRLRAWYRLGMGRHGMRQPPAEALRVEITFCEGLSKTFQEGYIPQRLFNIMRKLSQFVRVGKKGERSPIFQLIANKVNYFIYRGLTMRRNRVL